MFIFFNAAQTVVKLLTFICSAEPFVVCQTSSTQLAAAVAGSELAVFVCWAKRAQQRPALHAETQNCW